MPDVTPRLRREPVRIAWPAVLVTGAAALLGWAVGVGQDGLGEPRAASLLVALTALAGLAIALVYALTLLGQARVSRGLDRDIDRGLATADAALRRAERLARAEEIIASDPDGRTIDPVAEPELFRLYLFHTARIGAEELAAGSERDAALERLARDAERLRALFAAAADGSGAPAATPLQRWRVGEIARSLTLAAQATRRAE